MPAYEKLEQSFNGYIAVYYNADTLSFGQFSRIPGTLQQRVRNDAVIANIRRIRDIVRKTHDADIKTEHELRKERHEQIEQRLRCNKTPS